MESAPAVASPAPNEDKGPVPMSFPAVLRNSGIADRYAHLKLSTGTSIAAQTSATSYQAARKNRRDEKEGKRWIRRKENARFVGNPHIVPASKRDFFVNPPSVRSTFPEPLPAYLPRNKAVPPSTPPCREPISANAGRYSMSLKGMRRELRKSGPKTQLLVKEVEDEIVGWLRSGGVVLNPDAAVNDIPALGSPLGTLEVISEISRSPLQLVWSITDDAFARYVVHCCARYHNVVSFSKDVASQRLTYLLRPNVTRPDFLAPRALDTPPATDDSGLSAFEYASESDFVSDKSDTGGGSDVESVGGALGRGRPSRPLSNIAESAPASPVGRAILLSEDEWSVVGDSEPEAEAGDELAHSVGSLAINEHGIPLMENRGMRPVPLRLTVWERQRRNASSPSRSPARRVQLRSDPPTAGKAPMTENKLFYDYLFS